MRLKHTLMVIALVFLTSSCYGQITGRVVDAETGQPIEGAVVLVEWTMTKGLPGMTSTQPYSVMEVVSGKDGKFRLESVSSPMVNPPRITIYKKGYVAWNNEYIFPDWKKRKDFKWSEGVTIRLETFRKEYSRSDHVYFLHSVTHWGRLINEAYRWEELEKERKP